MLRFTAPATILSLGLAWAGFAFAPRQTVPPPPGAPGAEPTFVGATACVACHQDKHDVWKSGRHSKMVQPATSDGVKGDFSKGSVTLRGSRYRFRTENGSFFITESYLTGKEQEHRVEYTLGNRRIQHYLTTIDHGKIAVLPPSWDVQRRQWFHNLEIVRILDEEGLPEVRIDEDGEKVVQQWNKNCVGCHVSQEQVNYNPATRSYATKWQDFGTSCERCHGPGSLHVNQYTRSQDSRPLAERLILRPTRLDPKTSSMICAQCHSARNEIFPGFKAGENYDDYFLPVLEYGPRSERDPTYWADGRPRRFSNDAFGLWQSECFRRGGATCTSCHNDPHLPDVEKNAQLAPKNNALCTQCHESIGLRVSEHTRHRVTSQGSSCVECHMPKTVVSIKSTMRDHTISVPAPENTVTFGIPNACTECHTAKKAAWAAEMLAKWWPNGRRAKLMARAQTFTAARAGQPDAVSALLTIAQDATAGPLIQANAAGYLRGYADSGTIAGLVSATQSEQPVIRSIALSSLALSLNAVPTSQRSRAMIATSHVAPGGQPVAERTAARAAILAALGDPVRSVRVSALMSLIVLGDAEFTPEDERRFRRVSAEFEIEARLHQDDANNQSQLGLVLLMSGAYDRAATALMNTLGLDPDRPSTRFLLGLTRLGEDRYDEARGLFEQVLKTDPYYHLAQERLKDLERAPR